MKALKALFIFAVILPLSVNGQDYKKGNYYLEIEQYKNAEKLFRDILQSDAENPLTLYYLGETYYAQGKKDSAKVYYSKGIEADDKSGLNYIGLGKVSFETNKSEAEAKFEKALSVSRSRETEVPAAIAKFYVEEVKNADKALEYIAAAIEKEEENPLYFLIQGDAYLLKNDGSNALRNYERKALPLDQSLPLTQVKIGRLYTRTRNYDMAMKYYKQAISKDDQYAPAYKEIAEVYYKVGQYDKAISSYEKYLTIADKDADSEFRYASFIFLNKDFSNAINKLNSLLSTQKDNPIVYRLLAYSYYETEKYDEALKNINTFFEKAEESQVLASDYEYLGKINSKQGNKEAAVENFKKALEKDPSNYDLHVELGNIYYLDKQFSEAAKCYEGKLSQTKGSPNDYLNYGKMLYYQESFNKADSAFSILAKQIPHLPHGFLWKAKSLEQLDPEMKEGLAKEAYENFIKVAQEKANKYKSDLINAYSYLGSYYSQVNEVEKAASAWQKVQEIDPENVNAKEALKNYK